MRLQPSSSISRKAHEAGAIVFQMGQDSNFAPTTVQSFYRLSLWTETKEGRP